MFGFGIAEQTRVFILAFGFGFLLGIVYDTLRVIRMLFADTKKLIAVQDIVFSLITFFAVFNFFLVVNKGEFRGFFFLSIALGVLLYRLSFGAFVLFLFDKVFLFLKTVTKILLFPFRIIYRPIKRAGNCFIKKVKKFKKFFNLHLKNTDKVLYNKLRFQFLYKKIGNNKNDKDKNKDKI